VKTRILRACGLLLLIAGTALCLSGCAPVKPWERDALARRDMAFESDPMDSALEKHIRFSKEGSLPAGGGGGGGCGCN
jgi:hypothetical protein